MSAPSVEEFLRELLRASQFLESCAWVTAFPQSPDSQENDGRWTGKLCSVDEEIPSTEGMNAYYSIGVFNSTATSRDQYFTSGAACVLCDDVGTKKAPADKVLELLGEPSFKIQTSVTSQQWGYLLTRLAMNEEISPIHQRLKDLNLSDRNGMSVVRYGRLPAGIGYWRESRQI